MVVSLLQGEEISEKMDVTRYTHWPLYQDWTTTRDGSVVWITAWHEDVKGDHGPPGSPNGVWPYKFRSLDAEGEYLFDLTPEATNAAKVTVYYPNAIAGITTKPSVSTVGDSSSTPIGPITDPSSVDAPTNPIRTDELSKSCPYSPVAAVALIALLATLTMWRFTLHGFVIQGHTRTVHVADVHAKQINMTYFFGIRRNLDL